MKFLLLSLHVTYSPVFADYEDEQGEYAARKYCLESSPICSTKKNYGQVYSNAMECCSFFFVNL